MGYVDDYDASDVSFNTTPSGLGNGSVQSAIDAISVAIAGGVLNYNVISNTAFSTSANADTVIPGMVITPSAGTYAVWYNAENVGSGSGQSLNCTIYKSAVAIVDSLRKAAAPSGTHEFSNTTQTISQFTGLQTCGVQINPNGSGVTVNQRSLLLIRLGP